MVPRSGDEQEKVMFHRMKTFAASAVCAVLLCAMMPAPAHADPLVFTGRAGQVLAIESEADANTTKRVAEELAGLIHVVSVEPTTLSLIWSVRTRDNQFTILNGQGEFYPEDGVVTAAGTVAAGAFGSAEVSAYGYRENGKLMIELFINYKGIEVWTLQELELLSGTLPV
jgi:hypothetical protein